MSGSRRRGVTSAIALRPASVTLFRRPLVDIARPVNDTLAVIEIVRRFLGNIHTLLKRICSKPEHNLLRLCAQKKRTVSPVRILVSLRCISATVKRITLPHARQDTLVFSTQQILTNIWAQFVPLTVRSLPNSRAGARRSRNNR